MPAFPKHRAFQHGCKMKNVGWATLEFSLDLWEGGSKHPVEKSLPRTSLQSLSGVRSPTGLLSRGGFKSLGQGQTTPVGFKTHGGSPWASPTCPASGCVGTFGVGYSTVSHTDLHALPARNFLFPCCLAWGEACGVCACARL